MPSTWHDVMEALKECVTYLEEYENKQAFKTTDEKRFYALIKQCAELLLETYDERDEYSREKKQVWVIKTQVTTHEVQERIRGNILSWLTEARRLMPSNKWYSLKAAFESLWRHVESFCGSEAVQAAEAAVTVAAAEVKPQGVAEPTKKEKLEALMRQLKDLVFALQKELSDDKIKPV